MSFMLDLHSTGDCDGYTCPACRWEADQEPGTCTTCGDQLDSDGDCLAVTDTRCWCTDDEECSPCCHQRIDAHEQWKAWAVDTHGSIDAALAAEEAQWLAWVAWAEGERAELGAVRS